MPIVISKPVLYKQLNVLFIIALTANIYFS